MFKYREMTESDNGVVAALVRDNLKRYKLDIPGTVYFDEGLDTLSDYYGNDERRYYVIEDDNGQVILRDIQHLFCRSDHGCFLPRRIQVEFPGKTRDVKVYV